VKLPKGEASIRLKQDVMNLIDRPSADPVEIPYMSVVGVSKLIKTNRKLLPNWKSVKVSTKGDNPRIYLSGVKVKDSASAKIRTKYGNFVPEWKVGSLLKDCDMASLTPLHKKAVTEKFSEKYIGEPMLILAKKYGFSKARIVEVLHTALKKLDLEGRWML
jgi:hypothetical protein